MSILGPEPEIVTIKLNNRTYISTIHMVLQDCSTSLYEAIYSIQITNQWNIAKLSGYIKKFFIPLCIKWVIIEYTQLWRCLEKEDIVNIPMYLITQYSQCLKSMKDLQLLLDTRTRYSKIEFCRRFVDLYMVLYAYLFDYLTQSELLTNQLNISIVDRLDEIYAKYFEENQYLLIPIYYYRIYGVKEAREFLRCFGWWRKVLFWIHHKRIYRRQYIRWPKIITGNKS